MAQLTDFRERQDLCPTFARYQHNQFGMLNRPNKLKRS